MVLTGSRELRQRGLDAPRRVDGLPLQGVALMVLVSAGLFAMIDCTKGLDHKPAPGAVQPI